MKLYHYANILIDNSINIYRKHRLYINNLRDILIEINHSIEKDCANIKYNIYDYIVNNNDLLNKVKESIYLLTSIISQQILFNGTCNVRDNFSKNVVTIKKIDENIIDNNFNKEINSQTSAQQFFITNHQYYIERDNFNKDYKRKYKCIKTIDNINENKLNIVIMQQCSGPNSINYVLNEYDCKYLGITYKPNMQIFSSEGIKWIKCSNNKKLYK